MDIDSVVSKSAVQCVLRKDKQLANTKVLDHLLVRRKKLLGALNANSHHLNGTCQLFERMCNNVGNHRLQAQSAALSFRSATERYSDIGVAVAESLRSSCEPAFLAGSHRLSEVSSIFAQTDTCHNSEKSSLSFLVTLQNLLDRFTLLLSVAVSDFRHQLKTNIDANIKCCFNSVENQIADLRGILEAKQQLLASASSDNVRREDEVKSMCELIDASERKLVDQQECVSLDLRLLYQTKNRGRFAQLQGLTFAQYVDFHDSRIARCNGSIEAEQTAQHSIYLDLSEKVDCLRMGHQDAELLSHFVAALCEMVNELVDHTSVLLDTEAARHCSIQVLCNVELRKQLYLLEKAQQIASLQAAKDKAISGKVQAFSGNIQAAFLRCFSHLEHVWEKSHFAAFKIGNCGRFDIFRSELFSRHEIGRESLERQWHSSLQRVSQEESSCRLRVQHENEVRMNHFRDQLRSLDLKEQTARDTLFLNFRETWIELQQRASAEQVILMRTVCTSSVVSGTAALQRVHCIDKISDVGATVEEKLSESSWLFHRSRTPQVPAGGNCKHPIKTVNKLYVPARPAAAAAAVFDEDWG